MAIDMILFEKRHLHDSDAISIDIESSSVAQSTTIGKKADSGKQTLSWNGGGSRFKTSAAALLTKFVQNWSFSWDFLYYSAPKGGLERYPEKSHCLKPSFLMDLFRRHLLTKPYLLTLDTRVSRTEDMKILHELCTQICCLNRSNLCFFYKQSLFVILPINLISGFLPSVI